MLWLVIAIAALVAVIVLFALSLASATDMGGDDDAEMQALADLNRLEGPGGKPFFADREAVWDLAEQLEDPDLARPHDGKPHPRGS